MSLYRCSKGQAHKLQKMLMMRMPVGCLREGFYYSVEYGAIDCIDPLEMTGDDINWNSKSRTGDVIS